MSKPTSRLKACGVFLLWTAMAIALPAQTFTTLHSFDGADGGNTQAGLIQGSDGNFYGTTYIGGANGSGTLFKITPQGTLTTLYSFCSQGGSKCTDGGNPRAGLVQGTDGNFYGTTADYGTYSSGTVFKITPSGKLTTLYAFCVEGGGCPDGQSPYAGLIRGTNGDFYGTTYVGGTYTYFGTVFKITPDGKLTTLHSFNGSDGAYPYGGLVQAIDGNFYGTTFVGGANNDCSLGACGTVFKITPQGVLTTLHSFDGADGGDPFAGLVQGTDGSFYGTTWQGGANGVGTVFKITPTGTLTTLHSFDGTEGAFPEAGLVQGTDGNFYGATDQGGAKYDGTVFKVSATGTLTTLYSFCSRRDCRDGSNPIAGLVQDTNGAFYGTTYSGGTGNGTVFSLIVGLGPFVVTEPTSGKVGAAITILGTSLTGATSVTFNGTAASFTVKSKSEITTTVPVGATTGPVQVVTPTRTLSSNVPFTVN